MISGIRPAVHGVSAKSWSTMRSAFNAALQVASITDDPGRGLANRDKTWGPLMRAVAGDMRLSGGLAAFANWCCLQGIDPDGVDDSRVQEFLHWLEGRSLYRKPRDLVRRVPNVWNDASAGVAVWPRSRLTPISFRPPQKRLRWQHLCEAFRQEAEAYLELRARPDVFDERPNAPTRALAASTLRLQRDIIRLAASALIENDRVVTTLSDLIEPDHFKAVLRHYHEQAEGKASSFATTLAQTLIGIARYHARATAEQIAVLRRIAARLPAVPLDLTAKNKALLRQLESERTRARLLFLPDELLREVARDLEASRLRFVEAQVAIAVDILLAVPLRPQNLHRLKWSRHFYEPNGPRGRLMMYIPADETKSRKKEIVVEIPDQIARRLRWFRRTILPRLNANPDGPLFVRVDGRIKSQETITEQIIKTIGSRVGIHMTPHQFRHFGATSYLAANPEDFETVTQMLGHAWTKTSRIYAGVCSERAMGAYHRVLLEQREALRSKHPRNRRGRAG
jgi:integrase